MSKGAVHRALGGYSPGRADLSWIAKVILALIVLSTVALVIESMASVRAVAGGWFRIFEVTVVVVFTLEYAARLWSAPARPGFDGYGREALRPMMLVDLLAVLPFWLAVLVPGGFLAGVDLRSVRLLRLFRLLRVAKLARYSLALDTMALAFRSRKEELVLAAAGMGALLLISASMLYYIENPHQPEAFSSIPATMWWSVATLTTVGYGDVYPITAMGRFMGAITAILGIAMFAVPTGIMGAAFSEAMRPTGSTVASTSTDTSDGI